MIDRSIYVDPVPPDAVYAWDSALGTVGVMTDGEIVGLRANYKGAGVHLLALAIAHGGTRLHCIGEGLRRYYERYGFNVTHDYGTTDCPPDWPTAPEHYYYMERMTDGTH